MSGPLRARIGEMLLAHGVATLATIGSDGPWASAVFYASGPGLDLYFVTDPGTRHGRNLAADRRASAAIHAEAAGWSDIRGLQLEGTAARIPEAERAAVLEIYLNRFPDIRRLQEAPCDEAERGIARRLSTIALWRLSPTLIRLIDNRERFGWKQELRLPGPG